MMPQLLQALAVEHDRDRQRSVAAHIRPSRDSARRRPHRVAVRCGYWLISIGRRLVAPDLSTAAR
jgi:hypothetical protein